MSARPVDEVSLSHEAVAAVKRYPEAAAALPPFPEKWLASEISEVNQAAINTFAKSGVIQKQETERVMGNTRAIWQTRDGLQEWLDRHVDEATETTPCGRTSVRNVRGEDGYTCTHDDCDCRFSRERAKEVMVG